MAKGGREEGPQPPGGYFVPAVGGKDTPGKTQPNQRYVYNEAEFPVAQEDKSEIGKKVPFIKHAVFFLGLAILTYAYWFFGQLSLGFPDEYFATIFTVLIYNWFVKNDYELPKWLKK